MRRMGCLEMNHRQRRRIRPNSVSLRTDPQSKTMAILTPVTPRLMTPSVVLAIETVREQLVRAGWKLEI